MSYGEIPYTVKDDYDGPPENWWFWNASDYTVELVEARKSLTCKQYFIQSKYRFGTVGSELFASEDDAIAAALAYLNVVEQRVRTARINLEARRLRQKAGVAHF